MIFFTFISIPGLILRCILFDLKCELVKSESCVELYIAAMETCVMEKLVKIIMNRKKEINRCALSNILQGDMLFIIKTLHKEL